MQAFVLITSESLTVFVLILCVGIVFFIIWVVDEGVSDLNISIEMLTFVFSTKWTISL